MGAATEHVWMRKLCGSLFRPSVIDPWRPAMREVAEALAREFASDCSCEFVESFANRYPAHVFARIIGLPDEEVPRFARRSGDIGLTALRIDAA